METFTASNGDVVTLMSEKEINISAGVGVRHFMPPTNAVQALREFFLHERDQELGRWRCPESPDWVVHADKGGERAWVVNERQIMKRGCIWRSDLDVAVETPAVIAAARAFFEAHPVPKPWHDAKPGEVWLLTFLSGEQMIGLVDHDGECFIGGGQELTVIKSTAFTAGHRIWPEVE